MDEFPWATALGITVVAQPAHDMGRRAAQLVVERPAVPARIVVEPTSVPRTSCGETSVPIDPPDVTGNTVELEPLPRL